LLISGGQMPRAEQLPDSLAVIRPSGANVHRCSSSSRARPPRISEVDQDLGQHLAGAGHQPPHLEVVRGVPGQQGEELGHLGGAAPGQEVLDRGALGEVVVPVGVPGDVVGEQVEHGRDVTACERLVRHGDRGQVALLGGLIGRGGGHRGPSWSGRWMRRCSACPEVRGQAGPVASVG
jgi:hypothetical protein